MKNTRSMDYMGAIIGLKKVIDIQSYSKASVEMEISQPALSKRVKNLETLYGEKLIIKKNNIMSLTPVGKILYEEAEQFERINQITREKINLKKSQVNQKKIGISEQLYLNYVIHNKNSSYEYITFEDDKKLRKAFENNELDGILTCQKDINLFAYEQKKLVSMIDIKFYISKRKFNEKPINNDSIKNQQQLIYQPSHLSSLLTEYLINLNVLSQTFEYVDNYDIMFAKLILNPNLVCVTTSVNEIPSKYLDEIIDLDIPVEKIKIYLLEK